MAPPDRLKTRFSSRRLKNLVDKLDEQQKGFIIKNDFAYLLRISTFNVPTSFLEWVMKNINVSSAEFNNYDKSFKLSSQIVKQVLGIPSGSTPLNLSSASEDVKAEVEKIIPVYKVCGPHKSNIDNAVALCAADHNEDSFFSSFMMVAITSVLCPSTQNSLDFEYLNFLMDAGSVKTFDWADHIIKQILSSVRKYQGYIQSFKDDCQSGSHYFAGCLPLLAVSFFQIHVCSF